MQVAAFAETRARLERHLAKMEREEAEGKKKKKLKMPSKEDEKGRDDFLGRTYLLVFLQKEKKV